MRLYAIAWLDHVDGMLAVPYVGTYGTPEPRHQGTVIPVVIGESADLGSEFDALQSLHNNLTAQGRGWVIGMLNQKLSAGARQADARLWQHILLLVQAGLRRVYGAGGLGRYTGAVQDLAKAMRASLKIPNRTERYEIDELTGEPYPVSELAREEVEMAAEDLEGDPLDGVPGWMR